MYSNFSALKTNMAIYLSPSIHLTAMYIRGSLPGKNNKIPPLKPRPYKALAVNRSTTLTALVLFVSPVVKKKKLGVAKSML